MPTKEAILENIQNLQSRSWGDDQKTAEGIVWSDTSRGASFEIIKDSGYIMGDGVACLTLVLRGSKRGRNKLWKDFTTALGQPTIGIPASERNPQIYIWNINSTSEIPSNSPNRINVKVVGAVPLT